MPISGGISPPGVQAIVEEILEGLGIVSSNPPSEEEKQVNNIYVVEIEGNPRLKVEYEEE